jgi:hypothetical protein
VARALGTLAFLVAAAPSMAAPAPVPTKAPGSGPPFDAAVETGHRITFSVDTAPARDLLLLITHAPDGPGALRRLRAVKPIAAALAKEGLSTDDFFGRIVSATTGTPDELISSFAERAPTFLSVLDELDEDARSAAAREGRRVASVLPQSPAITAHFVLIPFLGIGGFDDVIAVPDDRGIALVSDLPRLTGDVSSPTSREIFLKVLRAAASEAWHSLFDANFRKPPAWPNDGSSDLDALLARTVEEGPPTLFLIPDEFFPISSLLEEPIARSFNRWNFVAESLLDPKKKKAEKEELIAETTRGEFWRRTAAIVGAQMTDGLIRVAGRDAYLRALAAGPRAVVSLYASSTKGTRLPMLSKPVKKALETRDPRS